MIPANVFLILPLQKEFEELKDFSGLKVFETQKKIRKFILKMNNKIITQKKFIKVMNKEFWELAKATFPSLKKLAE